VIALVVVLFAVLENI